MRLIGCFLIIVVALFLAIPSFSQTPTPTPTPRPADVESEREIEVLEQRQDTADGRFSPVVTSTQRTGRGERYRIEVGVMPRFNSNLFEAEDDAVKRSSFITTLSARGEYDLIRRDSLTVTGSAQLRYNIFKDVANANSAELDFALRFLSRKNDLQTRFFTTPERLAFITGAGQFVHNSSTGFNLDYTRRIGRRFRARGTYQLARESYEGDAFDDRNSTRHRFAAEGRYKIHDLFQPGLGVEYDRVNARSENFSRNGIAPVLILVSAYKNIIYTGARYRYIRRDYDTDDPLLPNFERTDYRHDFNIYSSVRLARQWRLFGFFSALENNASRPGRSFSGYQTGLGLYFVFP
jgi:hypothetical protein